ncbi:hypothetical protein ACFVH0_16450 [Streptomyces sp. NPDC127117]|uniref:hypothetical protein n=1 Tax=Streptomyces sp. NPDC127117 TaxID=3345368 RepID=UPI00363CC5E5
MSRPSRAAPPRPNTAPAAMAEDSASEALRFLHKARSSSREEQRRSFWFVLYTIVLVGGFWGVPALIVWSRTVQADGSAARMSDLASEVSLFLVPTVLFLVLLLSARGAMWRGPVVLDGPTVHLLLPSRVGRRALLLPRLRASAVLWSVIGAAVGALAGFLLQDISARPWTLLAAAGAVSGVCAALVSCAAGTLVERYAVALARRAGALFAAGWAVAVAAAVVTVLSWRGWEIRWLAQVLLWSGPWGWSAQPLLWALGVVGPQAAVGSVLSLCAAVLGLLLSVRELPRIPQSALRLRATVAARVGASVLMLDLRQARSGVPALRARRSVPLMRLPIPRHASLLVPWRDLSCLLRHPSRLGWALVWLVLALGGASSASSLVATSQLLAVLGSLLALYLAAAQLTEPARLESDDVRRSTNLGWSFRALALLHAVVPLAVLLVGVAAGAAVCVLAGAPVGLMASLTACVPGLVTAALVSSYRGVMPIHLLMGADTPMGNTGPWQAVLWYGRGPLVAICLLLPVCLTVARGQSWSFPQLLWQALVAAAGAWWARRTAHRLKTE